MLSQTLMILTRPRSTLLQDALGTVMLFAGLMAALHLT